MVNLMCRICWKSRHSCIRYGYGSQKLTLSHPRIREGLLTLLGEEVYKADGSLNKPVLANYLFASAENAGRVNRIIHPCVHEDFQQWADRQAASGTEVVAMESAILFESGFHAIVDYVVMVYAPLELRITRAMQRDAATEAQIRARISAQMDDEEKKRRADYVIFNDEKLQLDTQIAALEEWLAHRKTGR